MERYSRKRQAIYDCLRGTVCHPTADWIYRKLSPDFPDLSLATVYRNLSQMKASGMIAGIGTIQGQEHFDFNTAPHAHLYCTRCGRILDLMSEAELAPLAAQAEQISGCQVDQVSLCFSGLCPDCKSVNNM